MKYDVIVIGGGASGMMAAIHSASLHNKVLLIEKNKKLGKKLSVTGNGKCNLTNEHISLKEYHNCYPEQMNEILSNYDTQKILDYFESIGLHCKNKNGYYYPLSGQAAVVVQLLEAELLRNSVSVMTETEVCDVKIVNTNQFTVLTDKGIFESSGLIISSGGQAAPVYGSNDFGYRLLKSLGHTIKETSPALVQLNVKEKYIKKLSGVRFDAEISLETEDKKKYNDSGEIIFTDTGVSGIPVFQISRYTDSHSVLHIDAIPSYSHNEIETLLKKSVSHNKDLSLEYLMRGFCNHKLVYYLLLEAGFNPEERCSSLSDKDLIRMVSLFKNIRMSITGRKGFESAQVTKGGVPFNEINPKTMESVIIKNLYVTGELIDVDGICGGYNLHFAWASGMIAGKACCRK